MVAVRAGIPEGIKGNRLDMAGLVGADDDADLRFVARCRDSLRFFAAVDHIGRLPRQPGNVGRIDLHDRRLLGAEAAADARLDDADLGLRDFQGVGDDAAHVEGDLRRADDGQAAEGVLIGIGPEGFHGALLVLARMIGPVDDHVRRGQEGVDVAVFFRGFRDEVALRVAARIDESFPVVFRMDDDLAVQGLGEIEERLLDFVFYAQDAQGLIDGFFRFPGDESHGVADVADLFIEDEAVVRTQFRIGLAGNGEARLGHVVGRDDADDARHFFRRRLGDLLDDGSGMRAAQCLDDETILGHDVFRIDRLARDQGLGVLLGDRMIDGFEFH